MTQPAAPRSSFQIPPLLLWVAAGLGVVAVLAAGALLLNRNQQLRATGRILKVRTATPVEGQTLAVVTLRLENKGALLMLKELTAEATAADGSALEARLLTQMDFDRLLDYVQVLGKRECPVLKAREKVPGGTTADFSVGLTFAAPEAAVVARKNLKFTLLDADGVSIVIEEHPTAK